MSKKTPTQPASPAESGGDPGVITKPVLAALRCLRDTRLHHRTCTAGETLAVMQFQTDEDRRFFRGNLRWSNFALQDLPSDP